MSLFQTLKTAVKKIFGIEKKTGRRQRKERHGILGVGGVVRYPENLVIGKGSTLNDYSWLNARFGITIGENTLIGPFVLIHSGNHVIKNINIEQNATDEESWVGNDVQKRVTGEPVVIGNDVWIGANVTILAGAVIPDKCVIGAGTIITKSNSKRLSRGDIVVNDVKLRVIGNRTNYD